MLSKYLKSFLLMSVMLFSPSASALEFSNTISITEMNKLVGSDKNESDYFGGSVSISGEYAIVGAPEDAEDSSGGNPIIGSGSAYIYKKSAAGWTQIQKLVASDRGAYDYFGDSVSISGDYIIVGADYEDEDTSEENTLSSSGSAYIFRTKDNGVTWDEVQKLVASDRNVSDRFGESVSISGDYAIVGASNEDEDTSEGNTLSASGSAYIFSTVDSGDTWSEVQKIVASDRNANDEFGRSVSISGDYAIVGAANEDEDISGENTLSGSGSAYIFSTIDSGDTWSEVQKIVASDREAGDNFAESVSISGNYVIVGAHQEGGDSSGGHTRPPGSAYIFRTIDNGATWSEVQKIVASDRGAGDNFGTNVSISGDYVIVGAAFEDEDSLGENTLSSSGSAYIFRTTDNGATWSEVQKIVASDREAGDNFGESVAISGEYAIVGAPYEGEDDSGSAYIYNIPSKGINPAVIMYLLN